MDIIILIAIASVTILGLLGIGFFFSSQKKQAPQDQPRIPVQRQRDGVPRRIQIARNRTRMRGNAPLQEDESDGENNVADLAGNNIDLPDEKIGTKKRAKLEAKAEKKAQREVEEQLRAERKKREQLAEAERKMLEEKKVAEEKRIEEEQQKIKEDKEKREYEDYLKMKAAFSIEEEGYEESEGDQQNILQEFVSYIKNNKVVVIEDLAAHFKLKTQATIERIQDLQKDDILSGVIDDRGKFIYVSPQEMEAVAKFIRQRGRVSISELAENSNQLINLNPVTTVR